MNEAIRPSTAAPAQPLFNPLSPDFIRDPYPAYAQLRESRVDEATDVWLQQLRDEAYVEIRL